MKFKRFTLITMLILAIILTGCTSKDKNIDKKPKTIEDLMNNLDNISTKTTNEKVPNDGQKTKEDRSYALDRWKKSLAKEEKSEEKKRALGEQRTKAEEKIEEIKKQKEKKLAKEEKKVADKSSKKQIEKKEKEDEGEYSKVRVKFFGDTMAHYDQVQYAYNYGGGVYDFSNQFTYISDYVKDSDLSITNYETTTNPNRAYAGYPAFNTPGEYLKAIKNAGFNVVTTANNHTLDTDEEGVFTTIDAIKEAGLDFVGTHKTDDEKILYKEINGIKIAILSYTYGCNGKVDLLTPREEVGSVNYLHDDLIEKDIKEAKKNGADFIIVYPHWGIEYETYPVKEVVEKAHKMVDWGADLVIGNHPHVVQPVEKYTTKSGRDGLIAYALGNFVSMQSFESFGDARVEQSLSIELNLEKDKKNGNKKIGEIKYHPLWIASNYDEYGVSVKTYKCEDFLEGGSKYKEVNENQRARIKQAYDMTMETVNLKVEQ